MDSSQKGASLRERGAVTRLWMDLDGKEVVKGEGMMVVLMEGMMYVVKGCRRWLDVLTVPCMEVVRAR